MQNVFAKPIVLLEMQMKPTKTLLIFAIMCYKLNFQVPHAMQ